jgi:PQQ-dependent dehydrogenase (methanol/ethanol family)
VLGQHWISPSLVAALLLLFPLTEASRAADQPVSGAPAPGQYSALTQITPQNAGKLKLVFSHEIAQGGGYSGQLAVARDRLYLQTPFPHSILAFDLENPGQEPIWSNTPQSDSRALGLDCCSATIGGPALDGDRLYVNTFDGHTIAFDAATGQVAWNVRSADPHLGETLALPPLAVGGRLIIGNGGDDNGARGWIAALSTRDGHMLWKWNNTGADADVGIDARFAPAYAGERGSDLGIATWPPSAWRHGGGGLAGQPVYDAERRLLIYPTGHPAPWNPELRPGDDKWTSGIFARDAADGSARWFTPINGHDPYAFGAPGSLIATDFPWQGRSRPLLIHPDANGYVYVLDRASGEILAADPFIKVNADEGVELYSGRLQREDAKAIHTNTNTRDICPGWPGATGTDGLAVANAAFAPALGLLFIPVNGLCMDMEGRNATFIPGTAYMGANLRAKPMPGRDVGGIVAWNVVQRRIAWRGEEAFPVQSSVLATAGGVVFYGTLDGWFKALDAATGRPLWRYHATSGIIASPLTFERDGRQYVAIVAGIGGPIGRAAQNGIDLRDATAAHGFANALHDLPMPRSHGGTLYVFGLP